MDRKGISAYFYDIHKKTNYKIWIFMNYFLKTNRLKHQHYDYDTYAYVNYKQ